MRPVSWSTMDLLEQRTLLSNYFVSPAGSDSDAGLSDSPWKTLQKAADSVVAGDTVTVRAGEYAGFVLGWDFEQSGTAAAPITFHAEAGAIINARNSKTHDDIDMEGSSYVTIEGFHIIDGDGLITRAGIRASDNSTGVVIKNNT